MCTHIYINNMHIHINTQTVYIIMICKVGQHESSDSLFPQVISALN